MPKELSAEVIDQILDLFHNKGMIRQAIAKKLGISASACAKYLDLDPHRENNLEWVPIRLSDTYIGQMADSIEKNKRFPELAGALRELIELRTKTDTRVMLDPRRIRCESGDTYHQNMRTSRANALRML